MKFEAGGIGFGVGGRGLGVGGGGFGVGGRGLGVGGRTFRPIFFASANYFAPKWHNFYNSPKNQNVTYCFHKQAKRLFMAKNNSHYLVECGKGKKNRYVGVSPILLDILRGYIKTYTPARSIICLKVKPPKRPIPPAPYSKYSAMLNRRQAL